MGFEALGFRILLNPRCLTPPSKPETQNLKPDEFRAKSSKRARACGSDLLQRALLFNFRENLTIRSPEETDDVLYSKFEGLGFLAQGSGITPYSNQGALIVTSLWASG